jgi:hypothetical protein
LRKGSEINWAAAWLATLPFRPLVVALDWLTQRWTRFPAFSICMVAQKPRFSAAAPDLRA